MLSKFVDRLIRWLVLVLVDVLALVISVAFFIVLLACYGIVKAVELTSKRASSA